MSITTTNQLEKNILMCALKHDDYESLESCEGCTKHVDKIKMALYFWFGWPEVREILQTGKFQGRITTRTLEYVDGHIVNPISLKKLSTSAMPEPIVFGFSEEAQSPFLIIRFVDTIHNKEEGLPSNPNGTGGLAAQPKSFASVVLGALPNKGIQQYLTTYRLIKNEESLGFNLQNIVMLDLNDGQGITDYIVQLLQGKFEGKIVV